MRPEGVSGKVAQNTPRHAPRRKLSDFTCFGGTWGVWGVFFRTLLIMRARARVRKC